MIPQNGIRHTFTYGNEQITLETGRIARQTSAAVMLTMGDVAILATVVGNKNKASTDFFPLTVVYQEKSYAAGKIPGSYFKREARPGEREILTSRLIDRPLRPLFPKGFMHEVQVVCTVMSCDDKSILDVPAMIAASAALSISGLPFKGPIGGARVGLLNNEFVLNPNYSQLDKSQLDMVVAGTSEAVLMVESDAAQLSESKMLEAVFYAHQQSQIVIDNIKQFATKINIDHWDWQAPAVNDALATQISQQFLAQVQDAYGCIDKTQRVAKLTQIRKDAVDALVDDEAGIDEKDILAEVHKLEKSFVRTKVLQDKVRIDGRDTTSVRNITPEIGILPRTHGSALFTRGETQAIVTTTLGSMRDAQKIENLEGDQKNRFMLHYNFPPYCVGETGMMGSPKRREIGHGCLARRALLNVLPKEEDFPYAIRVVSEITESNGSSSMASVCGGSLSLMDSGVPISAPVAGIAMGLIKEGDQAVVLTDILGDEDHLGDMDFKVAGTASGITALQMDIKIEGINQEIMQQALEQALQARLHILEKMSQAISHSREEVSDNAPVFKKIQINPKKIRDLIGKGGETIRNLTETTGSEIDIDDSGAVSIYAVSKEGAVDAIESIKRICFEPEIGKIYRGIVKNIVDFGAFVAIAPGTEGLVHISQIKDERIDTVGSVLSLDQQLNVKVVDIDSRDRIKLTMLDIEQPVAV